MRNLAIFISVCFLLASRMECETRHAFVIGNDNYPGHELHNAVNDASRFIQV